jgi:hypothetical protein
MNSRTFIGTVIGAFGATVILSTVVPAAAYAADDWFIEQLKQTEGYPGPESVGTSPSHQTRSAQTNDTVTTPERSSDASRATQQKEGQGTDNSRPTPSQQ